MDFSARLNQFQHGPHVIYINRVAIQQGFLLSSLIIPILIAIRIARRGLSSFPFFFLFSIFFLIYVPFSIFSTQSQGSDDIGHMAQRIFQKDDVILHTDLMANTWLFRVGQKQLAWTMRIQYIKVDYSVQSSPSSSLVLPNTRLPHNPTLRVLSYNIRTQFLFWGLLNTSLLPTYSFCTLD